MIRKLLLPVSALLLACTVFGTSDDGFERRPDGIVVPGQGGWLLVQVRDESVLRVAFAKDRAQFDRASFIVPPAPAPTQWDIAATSDTVTLRTARVQARVNRSTGAIDFLDAAGRTILAERAGGRSIEPATVQGESTFHVGQQWQANAGESLQGLGQNQLGIVDLKGFDLEFWQRNTNVYVPFLVSNRGYGLLWDNPSATRFGDRQPFAAIPGEFLRDEQGHPGGLTLRRTLPGQAAEVLTTDKLDYLADEKETVHPAHRWTGTLVPPVTGDYQFQTYSNGSIQIRIGEKVVAQHWRQAWLTEFDQAKVHLEAGHSYPVVIDHGGEQATTLTLRWKLPAPDAPTALWSEVGDSIDYYFVYGPAIDDVIAGYRRLTGAATLLPRWAFGLWQSRQRYETAQQSVDVVAGYRQRGIPLDNIVQDWSYWPLDAWGSHRFDATRFPDPAGWLRSLHDQHVHVMISVWGKFYPGNENFDAMHRAGYLYEPTLKAGTKDWLGFNYTFYDTFNPGARKLFWSQLDQAIFRHGMDAWWMDATEPDIVQPSPPTLATSQAAIGRTALGSAARVLNAYPLFNSQAVYEGQRSTAPDQRVFILTRSGFAGIQRYATVTWSGDTTSTWSGLSKQIAAGLGFSISGAPYWTMDIGGYTMETRFAAKQPAAPDLAEWRELNVRWFQYGTFVPLTRLHGELQHREPWAFGDEASPAYQTIVRFDQLRYRLLPYIYSLAGAANRHGGTLMRPLMMDFPADPVACASADEYLFGPALLVAPVTTYQARSRSVHLPATPGGWYDFWNGAPVAGGQSVDADAPYDRLPVFVRAGAIVPTGPAIQYTAEKPADPITLHVYAGADGAFTLYEDDGLTYGYERGEFAEIPLRWDDAHRTLHVGARTGQFPGMLQERTFNIVVVSAKNPGSPAGPHAAGTVVKYSGAAVDAVIP